MKRFLISILVFALAALAADISGNWKATAEGPNGSMERTFVFKVDGNKVTGETTSSMMGKSTISDGKIDGDTVTFTITGSFGGNEVKINYKGKVTGSEIHFTSEMAGGDGGGQAIQWVAKKQ
jgi:hypothetical protein